MRQRPVRTAASSPRSSCRSSTCWPRWSAPVSWSRCCWHQLGGGEEPRDRRGRLADDRLRRVRRDEGHHLGADRQGRHADDRRRVMTIWVLAKFGFNPSALLGAAADASGKGESFLQPGLRYGVENADATKTLLSQAGLHLAGAGAGARHRRTAAHPDPVLHRARFQGRPEVGALGDRPDRHLLPDDAGAGLRRGGTGRVEGDLRAESRRQHRGAAVGRGARRGGYRARCGDAGGDRRGGLRDDSRGGRRA